MVRKCCWCCPGFSNLNLNYYQPVHSDIESLKQHSFYIRITNSTHTKSSTSTKLASTYVADSTLVVLVTANHITTMIASPILFPLSIK